jgi:putative nucleotidyltransferase with HDIG domain
MATRQPAHPPKKSGPMDAPRRLSIGQLQRALAHPLAQFGLFLGFVIALVAILSGGFQTRDLRLDGSRVGRESPQDIKVSRTFIYTEQDSAATEATRDRVSASVPPVYDWQEGLGEQIGGDLERAFEQQRRAMANALLATSVTPVNPAAPPGIAPDQRSRELLAPVPPARLLQLAQSTRAEHFNAALPGRLPDEEFELLARRGFPFEIERAASAIVRDVMGRILVSNVVDDLGARADRDQGVYLRRMRQERVLIEYHVTDLEQRMLGLEDTPRLIREAARERVSSLPDRESRQLAIAVATALIRPNTTYNEAITLQKRDAARRAVPDVINREVLRKGALLVGRGEPITERHVRIWDRMEAAQTGLGQAQVFTGLGLLALLFCVIIGRFARASIVTARPRPRDIAFVATTLLLFLLFARLGKAMSYAIAAQLPNIPAEAWQLFMPISAAGMLVRLMLRAEHALVFSIILAFLCGLIMDQSMTYAAYTLLGSLVGAGYVHQVKQRMALTWSGLVVGAASAAIAAAALLIQGELNNLAALITVGMAFGSGLMSGFLVSAVLPVFEAGFGYTTDIKLLELSNLNHPLLRELIIRSPGSYHHSMMVGSLCEAAAEAINCNSLLVRVGAYYHDIGKMKNPIYFAENQKHGENPHDKLKPNMSALIIKAHVKDGIEMGRAHGLPNEIIDFIAQHHGTSLIAYFYHKAKQQEDREVDSVDEKDYRYPGPKPQSRETAICLLADGIEAASRAMPNPTPARLKGLVHNMINRAFTDGQLDECDLTLRDLNIIEQAFLRILTGIYHHRPEYPEQKREREQREREREQRLSITKPPRPADRKPHASGERPAARPALDGELEGASQTQQAMLEDASHGEDIDMTGATAALQPTEPDLADRDPDGGDRRQAPPAQPPSPAPAQQGQEAPQGPQADG